MLFVLSTTFPRKMNASLLRSVLRDIPQRLTRARKLHLCASSLSHNPGPLTQFTDDEIMMKETVAKLAKEEIAPLVRKMEKENKVDDSLLKKLFENGVSLMNPSEIL